MTDSVKEAIEPLVSIRTTKSTTAFLPTEPTEHGQAESAIHDSSTFTFFAQDFANTSSTTISSSLHFAFMSYPLYEFENHLM